MTLTFDLIVGATSMSRCGKSDKAKAINSNINQLYGAAAVIVYGDIEAVQEIDF